MIDSVSVVIPAYNAEATLPRAINSVLGQTMPPDEIIVVNNHSSDETTAVAQQYGSEVRIVSPTEAGGGPSDSRNCGIESSRCEWIAFLDADDEWLPERIERHKRIAQNAPDVVWLSGDYESVADSRPLKRCGLSNTAQSQEDVLRDALLALGSTKRWSGDVIWTGTVTVKRAALDVVSQNDLWFDPEQRSSHDHDLWLRLAAHFPKMGYVWEPIARYHETNPTSVSRQTDCFDLSIVRLTERCRTLAEKLDAHRAGSVRRFVERITTHVCTEQFAVGNFSSGKQLYKASSGLGTRLPNYLRILSLMPTPMLKLMLRSWRLLRA